MTRTLSVCVPVVPVPVVLVVEVVIVVAVTDAVGVGEVMLAPGEAEPLATLLVYHQQRTKRRITATAEDATEGNVTLKVNHDGWGIEGTWTMLLRKPIHPPNRSVSSATHSTRQTQPNRAEYTTVMVGLAASLITGQSS